MDIQGVGLIERVIDRVIRHGWDTSDADAIAEPAPLLAEEIALLRLPGNKPLPPSLQRWLAFDSSWLTGLGWFSSPPPLVMEGLPLGENAAQMYGFTAQDPWVDMFTPFEKLLPGRCFPLVGGSDSRRLLYVGEPDAIGEYPVLVTDLDDEPYVAVMYPGLDVYLAELAGVIDLDLDTYTSLIDHPDYGSRMREHATRTGLGLEGTEIFALT